jgi:hypothetical protein
VRFCRQKRSTIEIEADPSTGRFVQHQVPITPLPLLIAKKDGEREGLLEELIDEMGEMQKTRKNTKRIGYFLCAVFVRWLFDSGRHTDHLPNQALDSCHI